MSMSLSNINSTDPEAYARAWTSGLGWGHYEDFMKNAASKFESPTISLRSYVIKVTSVTEPSKPIKFSFRNGLFGRELPEKEVDLVNFLTKKFKKAADTSIVKDAGDVKETTAEKAKAVGLDALKERFLKEENKVLYSRLKEDGDKAMEIAQNPRSIEIEIEYADRTNLNVLGGCRLSWNF